MHYFVIQPAYYIYSVISSIHPLNAPYTPRREGVERTKRHHLNICSISRKIDDVKLILCDNKLDLLLLNETWLNHSIGDPELAIEGYSLYRYDRDLGSGKRGGGGLVAYSRDHYQFESIQNWNICCPDIEIQWLKLVLPRTRPTDIANVY